VLTGGTPSGGTLRRGPWWLPYVLPAMFTAVAWIIQVQARGDLPTWTNVALISFGSLSALLAFILPLRQVGTERKGRLEAQALAEEAVGAYKLQMHDMLIPLSGIVTDIIAAGRGQVRRDVQQKLRQLVVDLAAENIGPERTRACFFEHTDGPPRTLTLKNWKGRNRQPHAPFVDGTPRGDSVFSLIDKRESSLVGDVSKAHLPEWSGNAEYKTFICATVSSGNLVYGMLTLDSLQVGDLCDDDLLLMRLLAQLLASGLAAG
jgi:hypothetical protein